MRFMTAKTRVLRPELTATTAVPLYSDAPSQSRRASRPSQIEAAAGHPAGVVSRQASSANIGSHGVDRARCRHPDLADKGRAAIAIAPHPPALVIDQGAWDAIEIGLVFQ